MCVALLFVATTMASVAAVATSMSSSSAAALLGCGARSFSPSASSPSVALSVPCSFSGLGQSFHARIASSRNLVLMKRGRAAGVSHSSSSGRRLVASAVSLSHRMYSRSIFLQGAFAFCWMTHCFKYWCISVPSFLRFCLSGNILASTITQLPSNCFMMNRDSSLQFNRLYSKIHHRAAVEREWL